MISGRDDRRRESTSYRSKRLSSIFLSILAGSLSLDDSEDSSLLALDGARPDDGECRCSSNAGVEGTEVIRLSQCAFVSGYDVARYSVEIW